MYKSFKLFLKEAHLEKSGYIKRALQSAEESMSKDMFKDFFDDNTRIFYDLNGNDVTDQIPQEYRKHSFHAKYANDAEALNALEERDYEGLEKEYQKILYKMIKDNYTYVCIKDTPLRIDGVYNIEFDLENGIIFYTSVTNKYGDEMFPYNEYKEPYMRVISRLRDCPNIDQGLLTTVEAQFKHDYDWSRSYDNRSSILKKTVMDTSILIPMVKDSMARISEFVEIDWPDGYKQREEFVANCMATNSVPIKDSKNTRKLTKLLMDEGPRVFEMYDLWLKKNYVKESNKLIVFSYDPFDLMGMSTGKGWTSCMGLPKGMYNDYVWNDIRYGTIIAMEIKNTDLDCENPSGRKLIKPYLRSDVTNRHKNFDNRDEIYMSPEPVIYGGTTFKFTNIVKKFSDQLNLNKRGIFHFRDNYVYQDNSPDEIEVYDDIIDEFRKIFPNADARQIHYDAGDNTYSYGSNDTMDLITEPKFAIQKYLTIVGEDDPNEIVKGKLPIQLKWWYHNFRIEDLRLRTLENIPRKVFGQFILSHSDVPNLHHFPELIGGDVFIDGSHQLSNLEGAENCVLTGFRGRKFTVSFCANLQSLKGITKNLESMQVIKLSNLPRLKDITALLDCEMKDGTLISFRETQYNNHVGDMENPLWQQVVALNNQFPNLKFKFFD